MRLIDIDQITDEYILNFACSRTAVGNIRDLLNCQLIVTDRWIPIEKQFPKKDGLYLVTILDLSLGIKYVDKCYFFSNPGKTYETYEESHWFDESYDKKVIAWQPLPIAYKE